VELPVCDLSEAHEPSATTLKAWTAAAVDVGCFSLVNHGIAADVRDACVAAARSFHSRDREWKESYAMSLSRGNRGYLGDDFRPAGEGTGRVVRDYASLDVGPESAPNPASIKSILLGRNVWPDIAGFREAVDRYHAAVRSSAAVVSQMFARVCGLDPGYLAHRSRQGCSLLRLLHYPRPATDLDEAPNGHTDYEWFTLIWQSSEGLEVLGRDGSTYLVPAEPDRVTVVIGDLLEVLSGGYLESTLHWVRPRHPDRYSLTYFAGPDFDQVVSPIAPCRPDTARRYPYLHVGNHLTGLRVRHFAHLRAAVADGSLKLPFEVPKTNPLKLAKVQRLESGAGGRAR
jgi:isopenicillin N synthase-like dioxygenase